ncbi:hypothetical protein Aca07nite_42050 [Actinoplanes capillaceus]|uniref:Uncharacterized protein n=1 Tax=Actinoplanes campanulatus TaxID=113559 RepID=A0ABQ3WKZ5_9ACTN|nr:hypothetical protein Aca07nite_42050 [Actinoplanes capillaceus]
MVSRKTSRQSMDFGSPGTHICVLYALNSATYLLARPGMVEVTGGDALNSAAHRRFLVWLSFGMRPAGYRGAERLQRGMPSSK